ncbi:hypothetical protein TCAL_11133 [Tigriopus californicus]|uniref:G-protein coupled receptors family 1 profile domain-containing protein n=2 Tax=Tigriopus californicus TaxID=6832 RepID=A0A553NNX1_TIGCA|nr:hypothetical protein TCAL_11133 [Tigriopus californicus]
MAMIFVAIVTGFLLSNSPRILLNFHEVVVLDNAMACSRAGFRSFPVWCRILTSFSHLFLVLNSSINILFYCMFNSQFRVEARKALNEMFEKCSRRDESGGLHCQNASRDRISPQRNKLKNTNTNPNSSSEMDEALLSNSGVNATKV